MSFNPILIGDRVRHDVRGLARQLVEQPPELLRSGEVTGSVGAPPGGLLVVGLVDVPVVVEPAGQLLGHGAGGRDELLAGDHLADHEVAQELVQVLDDALRAEDPAEGLLVAGLEGLLPALAVYLVEALVGVRKGCASDEGRQAYVSGSGTDAGGSGPT